MNNGVKEITVDDASILYTFMDSHQRKLKVLAIRLMTKAFAEQMKAHKDLSRKGAGQKFKATGSHQEKQSWDTQLPIFFIKLTDMLTNSFINQVQILHQNGCGLILISIVTTEEEIKQLEAVINDKLQKIFLSILK